MSSLLHFNWWSTQPDLKKTDTLIFLDIDAIASDHKKDFNPDTMASESESHPKISNEFFQSVKNKYFLWKTLFRYNEEISQHLINLCLKHSAKIVLYSERYSKTPPKEIQHIFSLTPLAPYIMDTIIYSWPSTLYKKIETTLINARKQLKSFIVLSYLENDFFKERTIDVSKDELLKEYFKKANDLLLKPLSLEAAPLLNYWNAFCKGKLSSVFFDLQKLSYLKIELGLNNNDLQTQLFKFLPRNKQLKHLTLKGFFLDDFISHLVIALKDMSSLTHLCISNNDLTHVNPLLHFLNGTTYHIPEIDFSHNSLTLDGQELLAKWLEPYPTSLKIHLNGTHTLDACILKAIYRNPHVQCFSDASFQMVRTPMKNLDDIIEQMMDQERFIYTSDKKAHNKSHCIIS